MAAVLTPEGRAARNAYMREYRRGNREKMAEYETNKWNRRGAEMLAQQEAEREKRIDGNSEIIC